MNIIQTLTELSSSDTVSTPIVFLTALLCAVVFLATLYGLHSLCCVPLNKVRRLHDIGYVAGIGEQHLSKKELANLVMKKRRVGHVPPVYPNGWFCIAESRDLSKGDVVSVTCLGLSLAVFRDHQGEVHAVDAHCPHMGANMAVGGTVKGDCIECPFHGWRFSGQDGKCRHIPYTEKVPEIARVKSYSTLEVNRHVYLWYHAEDCEPTWYPERLDELESGEWSYGGRTEHYVNAHIEEIPENGADLAHLRQVHEPSIITGIDLRHMFKKWAEFTHHRWCDVQWRPMEPPDGHAAVMNLTHRLELFGYLIPAPFNLTDLNVQAHQIGPGIVYLKFDHRFGRGAFVQHVTPVGPIRQLVRHHVYSSFPTMISKLILAAEAIQVERDIMIWNNKQYPAKPVMSRSKEDEMIVKHRRWYSQFYSENSPRLKISSDTLDW